MNVNSELRAFWHFNMESVYIIKTSRCVMVQLVFQGSFCVLVNSELARINFTEMPYLIQEKNATNFSHYLGVSKGGVSTDITNATNAEMSNAQSETSQPDLKENLLNVKVSRGFFFL